MESSSPNQQISRRRRPILHTCGVSLLSIARKIHSKASDNENPTGFITMKLTEFASRTRPFMYLMPLIQWLLIILLLIDEQVLAVENLLETHIPTLSRLFNKVDQIVIVMENLPGKSVVVASSLIRMSNRLVLFLGWGLNRVVSWLNFTNYVLKYLEPDTAREKDIVMVDVNCNDGHEPTSYDAKITEKTEVESGTITKNIAETVTKDYEEECNLKNLKLKAEEVKQEKADDQILDLFEFGWHMRPGKGGNASPMVRQIM